jgi:hypothetical protein
MIFNHGHWHFYTRYLGWRNHVSKSFGTNKRKLIYVILLTTLSKPNFMKFHETQVDEISWKISWLHGIFARVLQDKSCAIRVNTSDTLQSETYLRKQNTPDTTVVPESRRSGFTMIWPWPSSITMSWPWRSRLSAECPSSLSSKLTTSPAWRCVSYLLTNKTEYSMIKWRLTVEDPVAVNGYEYSIPLKMQYKLRSQHSLSCPLNPLKPLCVVLIRGPSLSNCSFNLPTQPIIPLDSSQQGYNATKRPSSKTEEDNFGLSFVRSIK